MSKKIRLLMGITLSEVGGSQKVVYNLLSSLPEQDYDLTLVTSPGGELLDWVDQLNDRRENKIHIVTMGCIRRNMSPYHDFITLFQLVSLMKKGSFDVTHFHNSKMGTLGRIAAKLCGVQKIYYTMHGLNLNKNTTGLLFPVLSWVERMIAGFTTKVVFVSKHDMEAGIQNGWASEKNACLIYNGLPKTSLTVNPLKHSYKPDHVPVIAFVARLAEPKDPEFAIRVSEKLYRSGCDHKLLLIGDGPKTETCERLIRSLGIEKRVSLLGKCDHVMELLLQSDIFCLFSKSEGLPISIIEAMQCGLPVIASDVGGIPELVEHGKTGYLVPCDDEDLTVKYLGELIYDKDLQVGMSMQAEKTAREKFNMEDLTSEYIMLYEKIHNNENA